MNPEQFNDEFDKESDALRKLMEFKYGRKVADVASELVCEIATVISLKSAIHGIKPMRLARCATETMARMIAGVDRHSEAEAKEKERN
jgi:hypothetical protein